MKWTTTNIEAKHRALREWHKFFCLIPRKILDNHEGKNVWVWLEYVERKGHRSVVFEYEWYFEYRLIEEK